DSSPPNRSCTASLRAPPAACLAASRNPPVLALTIWPLSHDASSASDRLLHSYVLTSVQTHDTGTVHPVGSHHSGARHSGIHHSGARHSWVSMRRKTTSPIPSSSMFSRMPLEVNPRCTCQACGSGSSVWEELSRATYPSLRRWSASAPIICREYPLPRCASASSIWHKNGTVAHSTAWCTLPTT